MSNDIISKTSPALDSEQPYDPDNPEAVNTFWDGAKIMLKGEQVGTARKPGQRGQQKTPTKIALTVRYSPEVVEYFRSTGKGWQARMDEVLREYVASHRKRA